MTTPTQLQQEAIEVMETLEDTVEHLCHEHFLSGEKVWVMIHALSDYKISEFPDSDEFYEEED
jgi:glucokinase